MQEDIFPWQYIKREKTEGKSTGTRIENTGGRNKKVSYLLPNTIRESYNFSKNKKVQGTYEGGPLPIY